MEFEYRLISEKRCNEIDSWNIKDPYGYGKKLSTHGNYWVTNEDESILFCLAFIPRHDDREGYNETYLFICNNEYHFVNYIVNDVKTKNNNMDWFVAVTILESSFVNEKGKEILLFLKDTISVFIQKHRREMPGEHFYFKFCYAEEEI